jgi:hypothetical protein
MRALRSGVLALVVVAAAVALVAAGWPSGRGGDDPSAPDVAAVLARHLDALTSAPLQLTVTVEVAADDPTLAALDTARDGVLRPADLAGERTFTFAQAADGTWRLTVRDGRFTWVDLRGTSAQHLDAVATDDGRPGVAAQAPLLLARVNALRLLHVADGRLDPRLLPAAADTLTPDEGEALVAALANERWVAVAGAATPDLAPRAAGLLTALAVPARLSLATELDEVRREGDELHASGHVTVSAGTGAARTAAPIPMDVVAVLGRDGSITGPVELTAELRDVAARIGGPTWLRSALAPFDAHDVPARVTASVTPSPVTTATEVTPAATVGLDRVATLVAAVVGDEPVSAGGR